MENLTARLQRKDFLLRLALLAGALVAALLLANVAASLLEIWRLDPGATVPGPWSDLFNTARASQRSDTLALLSLALFGGAALACLVFVLEQVIRWLWTWLQDLLRK
ncbi:MAG TPA: hypothetical protein PKM78_04375 [Anaerolineae bacterium]|nr:hypothetical protein [Anaerolineae bacterium]HNU05184.1 hypothetical protein [Anaerolineae bacterium]